MNLDAAQQGVMSIRLWEWSNIKTTVAIIHFLTADLY